MFLPGPGIERKAAVFTKPLPSQPDKSSEIESRALSANESSPISCSNSIPGGVSRSSHEEPSQRLRGPFSEIVNGPPEIKFTVKTGRTAISIPAVVLRYLFHGRMKTAEIGRNSSTSPRKRAAQPMSQPRSSSRFFPRVSATARRAAAGAEGSI